MDSASKIKALSACSGRLGLDRGFERALKALRYGNDREKWPKGDIVETSAYMEIEAIAAWNLVAQMDQGVLAAAPVFSDLTKFPWDAFYGKIHALLASYPCQPFSQAGLQNGVQDPRHIFPFIESGIDAARPVLCSFENVANHLNIGYSEVRRRISSLGYKVEADIFAAEQVGAPHLRKRLFILAVADTYCSEQSKRRGDLREMLGIPESQRQSEYRTTLPAGDRQAVGDAEHQRSQGRDGVREPALSSESGKPLDHSFIPRLEGHSRHGSARARFQDTVRSIAAASIWPAPQGPNQYQWEHPRLESRMGCTINGFDFTTDLLRMEGNAVVEQQAELAFRCLIEKFI